MPLACFWLTGALIRSTTIYPFIKFFAQGTGSPERALQPGSSERGAASSDPKVRGAFRCERVLLSFSFDRLLDLDPSSRAGAEEAFGEVSQVGHFFAEHLCRGPGEEERVV